MGRLASQWVFTSSMDFRESESRKVHSGSFRTLPSPYTFPVALRAVRDPKSGVDVLELKYLSHDPSVQGSYASGVEFAFGRRSLRPFEVRLPISERWDIGNFIARVDKALDSFSRVHETSKQAKSPFSTDRWRETLEHIRSALRQGREELRDLQPID